MEQADSHRRVVAAVRPLQVIVAAMAVGIAAFLALGLAVAPSASRTSTPVITYVAGAFAPVAVAAGVATSMVISASGRKRIMAGQRLITAAQPLGKGAEESLPTEKEQLYTLFAEVTIIRCACLEGAALLASLAYFLDRRPLAMVIASALVVLLLLRIPTASRLQRWADEQRRIIHQTRAPGS